MAMRDDLHLRWCRLGSFQCVLEGQASHGFDVCAVTHISLQRNENQKAQSMQQAARTASNRASKKWELCFGPPPPVSIDWPMLSGALVL